MSDRFLVLHFLVDKGCMLTDEELCDLADRIVTDIDADPPVLTYDGPDVENR